MENQRWLFNCVLNFPVDRAIICMIARMSNCRSLPDQRAWVNSQVKYECPDNWALVVPWVLQPHERGDCLGPDLCHFVFQSLQHVVEDPLCQILVDGRVLTQKPQETIHHQTNTEASLPTEKYYSHISSSR